jgi:hypothetical protein
MIKRALSRITDRQPVRTRRLNRAQHSNAYGDNSPVYKQKVSLNFILVLAVFVISGAFSAFSWTLDTTSELIFILSGWLISLCLNEFSHAYTALRGGDSSILTKGYLDLDPLKYTNGMLSVVLPSAMVLFGGVGLPGGCVYIDDSRLKSPK